MNVKDVIDKLENSDLDYAQDIIWELTCYENILKNATVAKEIQ